LTGTVEQLILNSKDRRTIPVKMQILSSGSPVTDATLTVPPVITVTYTSGILAVAVSPVDLLSPGLAEDGNSFRYDAPTTRWIFNLGTKALTASGTYTIGVVSGDDSAYTLDVSTCMIPFARK
jgi:hypothetical protein